MYFDQVIVSANFFVPLTSVCEGRPRCVAFQRTWQNYMKKCPDGSSFDSSYPRIVTVIPSGLARDNREAETMARVASSIAVWFGTNNGYPFLEKLLANLDKNLPPYNNGKNVEAALSLWSIENSIHQGAIGLGGRCLQRIIYDYKQGERLRPLTHVETDTAEVFITWLASDEGIRLLELLRRVSNRLFEAEKEARRKKFPELYKQ